MSSQRTEESRLIDSDSESPEDGNENSGCSPAFCQFPASVYFIMANEFCERFNYFGARTVLTLYLMRFLLLGPDTATALYHLFVVLCYFSPLLGGVVADGLLGRFWTIVLLSTVYCAGSAVLAGTAVPGLGLAGPLVGLLLIGVGTGGIKPNVSAFGADQLPAGNRRLREAFFSTFYFFINMGSLLATLLIPVVRSRVQCMGGDCYALAFGIPAASMLAALLVFVAGKRLYRVERPGASVVARSVCCLVSAARNYCRAEIKDADKRLLDYADADEYSPEFVADLRQFSRLLILYVPFPFFWTLFDQIGSRWTIQATQMDGYVSAGLSVLPDQMQALNSLLILIFIPIFDCCVYPLLAKINLPLSLLKRIGLGMLLTSAAFLSAMAVQLQVEAEAAVVPARGQMKVKFVNSMSACGASMGYAGLRETVLARSFSTGGIVPRTRRLSDVTAASDDCGFRLRRNLSARAANNSVDVFLFGDAASQNLVLAPASLKPRLKGKGLLRLLLAPNVSADARLRGASLLLRRNSRQPTNFTFAFANASASESPTEAAATPYAALRSGFYSTEIRGASAAIAELHTVPVRDGQVLTLALAPKVGGRIALLIVEDVRANSVKMLWQIPQYVLISVGEVLFSISGLALSYAEAPASMKSLVQALWLLCVGLGNIVVMIVSEVRLLPHQSHEFLMFALLMLVNFGLFVLLSLRYTPLSEKQTQLPMEQPKQRPASDKAE